MACRSGGHHVVDDVGLHPTLVSRRTNPQQETILRISSFHRRQMAWEGTWDGAKRFGYLEAQRLYDACLSPFARRPGSRHPALAVRGVLPKPANRIDLPLSQELFARVGLAICGDRPSCRAGLGSDI